MEKIKFDFEATKEIINVSPDASVPIGAPVNEEGVLSNDANAVGIVLDAQGVGVHRQLVVMTAGYCDIIDAQNIWGDEYSAEAIAAMNDIVFCDNHMIPGGSDPVLDNAKSTGGIGWTESGVLFDGIVVQSDHQAGFQPFDVFAGEKYTVVVDGTTYNDVETVIIGDLVVLGDNDGTFSEYPFAIAPNVGMAMFADDGEHSVKVIGSIAHKISEQYMPNVKKFKRIYADASVEELKEAEEWYRNGGLLFLAQRLVIDCSGSIDTVGVSFDTSDGVYTFYDDGSYAFDPIITTKPEDGDGSHSVIYLHSNVPGSNKVFEISVNDSGAITATEI